STRGAARISHVVVFIDQITSHLSTAISEKQQDYPPALRNACRAGLQLTNKYYTLTDCSPLYRVAMADFLNLLVLHPSFKDKYFKLAKWQPEWIVESIRLTRQMWETHYKLLPQPTSTSEPPPIPQKAPMGVLAGLGSASEARLGNTTSDPLNIWLTGRLHLDDQGMPVNALKWWIQQRCKGNTHGGLLQMALDVLSCPGEFFYPFYHVITKLLTSFVSPTATTVDVERAFSFGRDYV
ncbi:hypothetical protein PTTG_09384, partial [Puccinia triticina 1-1 BBBD Race 1]